MPKLKPGTIIPTPEKDVAITVAAMSDPDAMPYTDAEWDAVKPALKPGLWRLWAHRDWARLVLTIKERPE